MASSSGNDKVEPEIVREEPSLPSLPIYPDLELIADAGGNWSLSRVPPWVAAWAGLTPLEMEGAFLPAGLDQLGQALASVATEVELTGNPIAGYCVEFHDGEGTERAAMIHAWRPSWEAAPVMVRLMEVTAAVQAQKSVTASLPFHGIVGNADSTREMIRRIEVYGPVPTPVLITGETGTGKELVAKALHEVSNPARTGPFVALNCAALSSDLLESELFGHEKGAFTGAVKSHQGLFEQAHQGTLFLDEIGEMPLPAQAKLLRALENGTLARVGGEGEVRVSVRFIAATNVPLEQTVAKGSFRADLYHRIAVLRIHVPPLRERQEDIPLLVDFFLDDLAHRHQRRVVKITHQAQTILLSYTWPGNIRELRNALERLFVESTTGVIGWHAMEEWVKERTLLAPAQTPVPAPTPAIALPAPSPDETFGRPSKKPNREEINRALLQSDWNAAAAARLLGIHRATLYRYMQKFGISRPPGDEEQR